MAARARSGLFGRALARAALASGALAMLIPFVWMILTSLKPPDEIFLPGLRLLPHRWGALGNYARVFADVPMLTFLKNGALVCGAIVAIQILVAVPCAYALATLKMPGRGLLLALIIVALLIPIQAPSAPIYVALAKVGLLDSYAALILPFTLSAFAIFLLRQSFKTFPREIIEAARLDGHGELSIAWRVVLPSSWPAIGAFALFSAIAHWNDLYWPMVVVTRPELATPPLGVVFFRNQESGSDFGALMAAATVISAPLIAAFLLAQRAFVRGIAYTSLK